MSEINFKPCEATTESQRHALYDFIKAHGEASTIQLRDELGIAQPAARVYELRYGHGVLIETRRGHAYDAQGRRHSTAVYVLGGQS